MMTVINKFEKTSLFCHEYYMFLQLNLYMQLIMSPVTVTKQCDRWLKNDQRLHSDHFTEYNSNSVPKLTASRVPVRCSSSSALLPAKKEKT